MVHVPRCVLPCPLSEIGTTCIQEAITFVRPATSLSSTLRADFRNIKRVNVLHFEMQLALELNSEARVVPILLIDKMIDSTPSRVFLRHAA